MTQNQGGQSNSQSGRGGGGAAAGRPAVLDQISPTTFDDLEQQFAEGDRGEWKRFTQSFGWDQQQSDEVWNWFSQRPAQGGQTRREGFTAEGPGLGGK